MGSPPERVEMLVRFYRQGRKEYGLTAEQALSYARDRVLVWTTDYAVTQEVDYDGEVVDGRYIELVILLWDAETEETVQVLGGVQIDFEVSDHGNIDFDEHDPWYVFTVASLIREAEAEREAA